MRLIDADALKEKILTTTFTENNMWALNLLIGLIDDIPTDDAWISVKEKPPIFGDIVLFTGKDYYDGDQFLTQRGYFDGDNWYSDCKNIGIMKGKGKVTHWMPLPEPPRGKN